MSWPRYWISGRPPTHSILRGVDLLEPRDERQRHRLEALAAAAEDQQRRRLAGSSGRLVRAAAPPSSNCVAPAAEPTIRATPFGSMISTTAPSPRMVLPEKSWMCRSFEDIGFTTISSVWKTPSTRMPKRWRPTCVTTTKPSSPASASAPGRPEHVGDRHDRQEPVAQAQHRRAVDALDGVFGSRPDAHELEHRDLRDREALARRR